MQKKLRAKDFEIRPFRSGGQITGAPEWMYEIIYHHPSGRSVRLSVSFARKEDAKKHIRNVIQAVKSMEGEKNEG